MFNKNWVNILPDDFKVLSTYFLARNHALRSLTLEPIRAREFCGNRAEDSLTINIARLAALGVTKK
jgi:hypothetical protein